jgi:hypothetical protein
MAGAKARVSAQSRQSGCSGSWLAVPLPRVGLPQQEQGRTWASASSAHVSEMERMLAG